MSAHIVSFSDWQLDGASHVDDPQRARERDTQRRLQIVARRMASLDERQVDIVFSVLGKALDWYDRKGALE